MQSWIFISPYSLILYHKFYFLYLKVGSSFKNIKFVWLYFPFSDKYFMILFLIFIVLNKYRCMCIYLFIHN